MILSSLRLENFKQFRDPLVLVPPEGAVGIVGSNGSGKTTLFEAILWAFFGTKAGGPRFGNDAIPWSGGSTAERSLVEVVLDVGGASYTVSRSLHRGKATAFVHDGAGEQITSGPADVSGWVQEKLLEMDRIAFDATFFARQKELAFFAGTTGVNRQREVGRLLGLEQVRDAQSLLREDRKALGAQVKLIEQTLEEVDFDAIEADHAEQRKLHEELTRRVSEATEKLASRTKSLEAARSEDTRLEKLYREHNALSSKLGAATSARDHSAQRITDFEVRLRRMDADEQRIRELEPEAKGLSEIEAEIGNLEESRRREERREGARKELGRIRRDIYETSKEAADLIEELPADDTLFPGWDDITEEHDDELEQARAAAGLLENADEEHDLAFERLASLKKVGELYSDLESREVRLGNAATAIRNKEAEIARLDEQLKALAGEVSLDERILALREERDGLREESSRLVGLARATDEEAKKLARAREMIESSDEHAKCPTCQRGYEDDEHTEVIASLRRQEDELSERAEGTRAESRQLEAKATKLEAGVSSLEKSRSEFQEMSTKRAGEASTLNGYIELRDGIESEAADLRGRIGGAKKPTEADIEAAEESASRLRRLRDARPKLLTLVSSGDRLHVAASEKESEVEALSGGEPYDSERHETLKARSSGIRTVIGKLEELRTSLEARPEVEASLESERTSLKTHTANASELEAGIKGLGFSEDGYEEARRAVADAERLRDGAREEKSIAEEELRDVAARVAALQKELDGYAGQRRVADEKSVEFASLGSMDSLFTEFYRELTARVRPQLQREASDLVKTLTNGRYQQMEFDENYGVRLYDGLSDAYEISRFSGGEADIVSLSARVALSKMISGKGAGALGFIVLDEVFGALDANRRTNMLLALERLKATFGQIFIISHVQDVQESQLLDETWFVEEDDEGKSSVRIVRHDAIHPVEPGS